MRIKEMVLHGFTRKQEIHRIKKEQSSLREMLGRETYQGTDVLFNKHTLAWLVVIVTVFLQVISLATTFEGSKMYFGGIILPLGLSAPLLFALAIQSIVFAMSHIIRKYYKVWLIVILIAATLCSTYFSYIGIYNHINPPIDYLEERYKQIYDKLNNQNQLAIDESVQEMKGYVFDLIGDLSLSYTELAKEVEENQALEALIDSIEIENQEILPQVNNIARPNRATYGENVDQYYEDMREYNALVADMVSDSANQDAMLQQELHENTVKAYLGGRTQEEFIKDSIRAESAKEQIEKAVENMYQLIGVSGTEEVAIDEKLTAIQMYCLDFITAGKGDKEIFSTILTHFITVGEGYIDTARFENFKADLGHFVLLKEEDHVLLKPLEEIKQQVHEQTYGETPEGEVILGQEQAMVLHTKMQAELKQAAYQLNQLQVLEEKIDLTHTDYTLYNLYILPLKNLVLDSDIKEMAWFCLGFAILIDGLTLLFALMQGKEKSLLAVKSNRQITGRSQEGMEELLITTIMDHYVDDKEHSVIESVRMHLRKFLYPFKLMPEGVENGYSMICAVEKLEDYNIFVAVLCQFNLAVIFSGEELCWLESSEKTSRRKYILLKTKFVMWAKQKIADLAFKEEYLDAVKAVDNEIINMGGEQV